MNLIKNLVSRNKNRIDVNNNSLDVSFITSRVLAMAFPSDNIVESLIHNNIDEISLFLTLGISTTTLSITYQALTTIAANSTTTSLSLNGQTTKLLLSSISSSLRKRFDFPFKEGYKCGYLSLLGRERPNRNYDMLSSFIQRSDE